MAVEREVSSFEEYVLARSVGLQRFAYLITRDADDARDLVQEALTGLYRHWEQVSQRGDPEGYVRRSIVNAHIEAWRRTGREQPTDDPTVFDTLIQDEPSGRIADADLVRRLFAQLAPRQRAVLVMRFYEHRSFAEIAEACDCAEATARSLVHRALAALRARHPGIDHD